MEPEHEDAALRTMTMLLSTDILQHLLQHECKWCENSFCNDNNKVHSSAVDKSGPTTLSTTALLRYMRFLLRLLTIRA